MVKLQLEIGRQAIQQRLNWLFYPVILIFALFAVRLWELQILQGAEYARLADQNRIRSVQVMAPRGPILDRFGVPLVENRPSLNIVLDREMMKDPAGTADFINQKLGISTEDLAVLLHRGKRAGPFHPIAIKDDVGIEEVSVVEAHKREHPEIQLEPVPRRLYRFGSLAAHVLGYVSSVTEDDLADEVFPGIQSGDVVGRTGVERTYNQCLMGQNGARQVLVDSIGRELGQLDEKAAVIGGDLQLTLDYDLQKQAESLLDDNVGAIVAMDPRNGEILAMADAPSFNPNSFASHISAKDYNELANDPNRPFQNRAIQNTYPPGSIFKLVMAETGLDEGFVDDSTHVVCRGSAVFFDNVFHCWSETGHGYVDLEAAITHSCNIFFYTLGARMGIEPIAKHAEALGFGAATGIDLPGEHVGIMPSPEWKMKTRGEKWFGGETISVAIGQGPIRATPLQVLRAVCAIATDGKLVTPHLLMRAERGPVPDPWPVQQLPIKPESARRIRAGMWGSVNNNGTGHSAALPGLDICGKTGTVQVVSSEHRKEIKTDLSDIQNHAWFCGFANRDDPEIAVVIFLEHGGGGGAAAAPMAQQMFRTYFAKRGHPELSNKSAAGGPGR
ncbi:MAG: penicillin-binding protein 2 [Acidobacteriota bacterium]|jgi:penicillin-binding protein 2